MSTPKNITKALKNRVSIENTHPSVTPLFQSSAFSAESPYFYSRKDNPNVKEFEDTVAILEEAKFALATTTGMSAITLTLSLVKPGESIVINELIYGCSYALFQLIGKTRDINVKVLDLTKSNIVENFPDNTKLIFFETPTNPFLKTISIMKLSKKIKAKFPEALIAVDNTWATPLFQKPLTLGADISLHSATKFISGHSDVMGGVILSNDQDIAENLRNLRFYFGANLDPHSAWLLRRSLQTISIRMKDHAEKSKVMLNWLREKEFIEEVYYPEISEKQLNNYGGILFFQLKSFQKNEYEIFRDSLQYFDTGTGMACITSMVAQPYSGSHASLSDIEKIEMGINTGLIRLCFGLESIDLLKEDLNSAFNLMLNNS